MAAGRHDLWNKIDVSGSEDWSTRMEEQWQHKEIRMNNK